jgi:16S rRNA (guanine966-N2)-methyltransferase
MRIISGTLKGRKIPAPAGRGVRPTSDRTKEAIFSILESRMEWRGARVLDLYAGSGNLGFEALSRGAANVLFVEQDPSVMKGIQKTAQSLDVAAQCRFRTQSTELFLKGNNETFDLIFADPPYEQPELAELPSWILGDEGILADDGRLVVEHDKRISFKEHEKCVLSRPYGRTIVSLFAP